MRNILFLIQSHFWQLSGQLHFLFFPQRRCQSTDEKEEVFFLAWSIFVLIVKTLSLNHQAKPLPKSLGIVIWMVIWSDPLPQGREVPEWLCLSAQPEMCLPGQNDVAPRWPKPGLSLVSAPGSSDQGIIHSPFYSPATLKGNIQGCQQLITADIPADQSCRVTADIRAVAQELLPRLCCCSHRAWTLPELLWVTRAHWSCTVPWDMHRAGQKDPKGPSSLLCHPQQWPGAVTHRMGLDKCVMLVFCLPLPPGMCSWASWPKSDEVCSLASSFHLFSSGSQ